MSRAACDNEPVRAMPSSNSILPAPTEHRLPKSTRNRTARLVAMFNRSSEFPGGCGGDREQDLVLRGVAHLEDERPSSRQFEFNDLMRCSALMLTLKVRGLQ